MTDKKRKPFSVQVDANTRTVFKMHDKMVMLADWLSSLGIRSRYSSERQTEIYLDEILETNINGSGIDSDTLDQLENKLKRYRSEIQLLRKRGIGKMISSITEIYMQLLFLFQQVQIN